MGDGGLFEKCVDLCGVKNKSNQSENLN